MHAAYEVMAERISALKQRVQEGYQLSNEFIEAVEAQAIRWMLLGKYPDLIYRGRLETGAVEITWFGLPYVAYLVRNELGEIDDIEFYIQMRKP